MDMTDLQSDGAQGGPEWDRWAVRREPASLSPAELHPLCPDCSGSANGDWKYHAECGFAWSVHDTTDALAKLPFGCPTEVIARLRWGDR